MQLRRSHLNLKAWIRALTIFLLAAVLPAMAWQRPAQAAPVMRPSEESGGTRITAVFPSFSSSNVQSFKMNGSAQVNSAESAIQLTPASGTTYGTAWWMQRVSLSNQRSFSANFSFQLKNPGGSEGADGLTFAIQTNSNSAGSTGQGLGIGGISPSFAVEFDTYPNTGSPTYDIDGNHVGIDVNGNTDSIWGTSYPSDFSTGGPYYAWVDYNGASDQMEIRVGTSNDRSAANLLFSDTFGSHNGGTPLYNVVGQDVFVGFTAATGAAWQQHLIKSFYFNNDYVAGGITPNTVTYTAYPAIVDLTASPSSTPAGGAPSTLTICTRDSSNNPMAGETVGLSASAGTLSTGTITTGGDGCGSATLASSTVTTANVWARAAGGVTGETSVSFTATPPTSFTSAAPAGGTFGTAYNHTFQANGYPTPSYSVESGSLPAGLSLNGSTGLLSGTPSAAGTYNFMIRASNSGGSYDRAYSVTIDKAASSTAISGINPSTTVYGQDYTVSVAASGVSPAPSGNVTVGDGDNNCVVTLDGSGTGSCVLHSMAAGGKTISANYPGNNNYYPSAAPTQSHTVDRASSSISLVSSAPASVFGQPFHLTATAAPVSPGTITPNGDVQFYMDGEAIGSPVTLEAGVAVSPDLHTVLGQHPAVGSYNFTASYLGDSNTYPSDTPSPVTQTISPAPTHVSIASSLDPAVYGNSLEMTISVAADAPSMAVPAGSVQMSIDGVPFKSALTLDATGHASQTVPYLNLWPGNHAITAVYTPQEPAQFNASDNTTAPLTQIVNKANPTFQITSSSASPVATEAQTFHVVVGHVLDTQGTPSGSVQFNIDGSPLGQPVTLDNTGAATSQPASVAAGPHAITVSYSGDDYFTTVPASSALSQDVAPAVTSTSIDQISTESAVVGQPVTVRLHVSAVSPAGGTPTGTVTVSNGTDSCTADLAGDGSGACELAATATGNPTLTASYSGGADFSPSISEPSAGPAIAKADSQVALTGMSKANPVVGEPITLQFSVAAVAPGFAAPSGTVTVSLDATHFCVADLSAGQCALAFPSAGSASVRLDYSGDDHLNRSQSSPLAGPVVAKAGTSLSVSTDAAAPVYGQVVNLTVELGVVAPGAGTPTGEVQFKVDGRDMGDPVGLEGALAHSQPITITALGTHAYTATYLGDSNFQTATAEASNYDAGQADTDTVLTSELNPSPYGMPVLVTATVTSRAPSLAVPTGGNVQFTIDGVPYGAPVALDARGQARKLLPYTALWVGQHTVTGAYSGSANFKPSDNTASPLLQVVEKGDLALTLATSVDCPVFGQTFHFTATVATNNDSRPGATGTLRFILDGADLGILVPLDAHSAATSAELPNLSVGGHSLTVIYSGDDYYQAKTLQVNPAVVIEPGSATASITGVTLGSGEPAASVVVGQPFTVTVQAAAREPSSGIPGGTVTVSNGTDSCTATLAADGTGSCELVPTTVGSPELTLSYGGDSNFAPSGPAAAAPGPAVSPASTTVTWDSTEPASPVVGQPFTVTVRVAAQAPSTARPGGTVVISNGTDSCTATVGPDGLASCQIIPTAVGSPDLRFAFTGAPGFADSNPDPVPGPQVDKAASAISVVPASNLILEGAANRFEAIVQVVAPGSGTPTGQVQFRVDGADYGAPQDLADGRAVVDGPGDLASGLHTVAAAYLGDFDFSPATATAVSWKIVEGDISAAIDPGEAASLTYNGLQDGQPVSVTLDIPAGALSTRTALVLKWLDASRHPAGEGKDDVAAFTLTAYQDGQPVDDLQFTVPVVAQIHYTRPDRQASALDLVRWNGSAWAGDGIEITDRNPAEHLVSARFDRTGEFALAGQHTHICFFPIISQK